MRDIIKDNKYLYLYFIFIVVVISTVFTPIYAKFTNDYSTEDDAVGISFDFNLSIQDIEEYESISIDSFNAKIFNIKVTNSTSNIIYYGAWYRMVEPSSKDDNIIISKLEESEADTSGSVEGGKDKIITVIIKNKTDKKVKVDFGVSSSDKDTNSIEYLDGKRLISGIDSITYLNKVLAGSYVSYTASNGCSGNTCSGENVNYVNKDNMGYCNDEKHKFNKTGWQVAYVKEDSVYLISAGSLECVATDSLGNISLDNKKLDSFEKTVGSSKHLTNLNKEALKYCNEEFVVDSLCNSNTAWAFNDRDLNIINNMPPKACYKIHSEACDGVNDIITGSGDYWLATNFENSTTNYYWDGVNNYLFNADTSNSYGLRPVVKMDPNVYIVDGNGTSSNPYKIANELIKETN
ncbi:MAG: hypothetical protein IKF19_03970 [Bacilli bacterium]|nr:hypothetical protein [Bacilli bacterium]